MIEILKFDIANKLIYDNNLKKYIDSDVDYETIYDSIALLPIVSKVIIKMIKANKLEESRLIKLTSAISYVFNPIDILAEEYDGTFAYLDDCYILYSTILKILSDKEVEAIGLNSSQITEFSEISFKYIPSNLQDQVVSFAKKLIGTNT